MGPALKFFFPIIVLMDCIHSYKILGVFPVAARSHYILENGLMKGLAEAGHDVTILASFEEKTPPNNGKYKQIVLKEAYEMQMAFFKYLLTASEEEKKRIANPFTFASIFNNVGYTLSELVLNNTETQQLIKSKEHFDIVIVSQFYMEATKALAPYFGSHLVIFTSYYANSWINHFVGNSKLPSLEPEVELGSTLKMNLKDRIINTFFRILVYFNQNFVRYPAQVELVHKYISKDIDLYKTQYNVSLVLSNGHTSLNLPSTTVPCVKDIAGFHILPPKKLPHDLQKYLDSAEEGVIYFSMGSNFNSTFFPVEVRNMFLKVFSKRKEQVLWKFEDDDLPGKPANIKIEKWLPQSDLLAHPNIKLFITHGGFLSIVETVYHGIPAIAIPVYGDQQQNAKMAEDIGFAKILDLATITEETLNDAIKEVLSNKRYRENVQERSKIFHDRPLKPMDEAIYWLEYIVRHKGANHLRVGYLDLTWYQYYMVDVFAIIFGVIFAIYFIITRALYWMFNKAFKKKTNVIKTKKVKKQ